MQLEVHPYLQNPILLAYAQSLGKAIIKIFHSLDFRESFDNILMFKVWL